MESTLTYVREGEAARMLSISIALLRKWRRERRGPKFVRLEARCIRYSMREIERWLMAGADSSSYSLQCAEGADHV